MRQTACAAIPSRVPVKPSLDADRTCIHAERCGNVCPHGGNMRRELRLLSNHGRINVDDPVAVRRQHTADKRQKVQRIRALVGRILVRKVLADVAERRRAEQRVRDGVQQHVRIRMPEQPERMRDFHAAENEVTPRHKAVHVIAVPDPKR